MFKYSVIVCKTYLFLKQKYFAPKEMLYNIPEVCYDICWDNDIIIKTVRMKTMGL